MFIYKGPKSAFHGKKIILTGFPVAFPGSVHHFKREKKNHSNPEQTEEKRPNEATGAHRGTKQSCVSECKYFFGWFGFVYLREKKEKKEEKNTMFGRGEQEEE